MSALGGEGKVCGLFVSSVGMDGCLSSPFLPPLSLHFPIFLPLLWATIRVCLCRCVDLYHVLYRFKFLSALLLHLLFFLHFLFSLFPLHFYYHDLSSYFLPSLLPFLLLLFLLPFLLSLLFIFHLIFFRPSHRSSFLSIFAVGVFRRLSPS